MDAQPPRTPQQRQHDTLTRLEQDIDAWVAAADAGSGTPYLVPLSFLWDGHTVLLATPAASPTGCNLQTTGQVRLGLGPTRDVVLIEGTVETLAQRAVARPLTAQARRSEQEKGTASGVPPAERGSAQSES